MGGRSSSSSQANQQTVTTNQDNRIANDSGVVAQGGSIVNVETIDAGLVSKALETVQLSDVIQGEGLDKLLTVAGDFMSGTQGAARHFFDGTQDTARHFFDGSQDTARHYFDVAQNSLMDFFNGTQDTASRFADTASSMAGQFQQNVLQAYSQAEADKSGAIDQRTMIIMGVVAAIALVLMTRKKG